MVSRVLLNFLMVCGLVMGAGCGMGTAEAPVQTGAVISMPAPTAILMASEMPGTGGGATATGSAPTAEDTLKEGIACTLINSQDLAHLFPPHNEIVRDKPKTSAVSQPPFSEITASGTETVCLFLDFHQPGGNTGWMLQVIYRVDQPEAGTETVWRQAWEAAMEAGSPVSDLGDEAFTSGAKLYIKKGEVYYTFEASDTHLDEKNPGDVKQLLGYELQLAEEGFQ